MSVTSSWRRREGLWGYPLVSLAVLACVLFQIVPLFVAAIQSLQKFNPITHASRGFTGFTNFEALFASGTFWRAAINTLVYGLIAAPLEIILGLLIALLLDRSIALTPVGRTAIIAALALSESVVALFGFTVLNEHTGLINGVLNLFGVNGPGWLVTSPLSMLSVIGVTVWHQVGLITLIYLAGLQGLNPELYDAADVDGASSWTKLTHLTIPLLRRSSMLAIFMAMITSLRIFTPIQVMTNGGPSASSSNLIFYVYQAGIQQLDYGLASAGTVCLFVILGIAAAAQVFVFARNR